MIITELIHSYILFKNNHYRILKVIENNTPNRRNSLKSGIWKLNKLKSTACKGHQQLNNKNEKTKYIKSKVRLGHFYQEHIQVITMHNIDPKSVRFRKIKIKITMIELYVSICMITIKIEKITKIKK